MELAIERERLVVDARDHIANYPEAVKTQFEKLLISAQEAQQLQEDHNWWIDQQGPAQMRTVFFEIGRRFASQGGLEEPNDIFMLKGDEFIDSARSGFSGDFRSMVSERKDEMIQWQDISPPTDLGIIDQTRPPGAPTESMKQFGRAFGRFDGATSVSGEDAHSDLISGSPASSGKVTATARVITDLSEAGRLNPGEILVTKSTLPPWTPLFAVAAGVVTDAGGALSHAAIVAREYAIPGVVGAVVATNRIKDGQRIEVDGDAGTVRLLDD